MNIKQRIIKHALLLFVVFSLGGIINVNHTDVVLAWCNDGETWTTTSAKLPDCFYDNMKQAVTLTQNNQLVTTDSYEKIVNSCMDNGGSDAGACSNAALTCLRSTIINSQCANGAYTGAIADDCNAGRLDSEQLCDPIGKANFDTISEVENQATGNIQCTNQDTSADAKKRCSQAIADAKSQCAKDAGLYVSPTTNQRKLTLGMGGSNGQSLDNINTGDYAQCLKQNIVKAANDDKQMCETAGGVYIGQDYKDPVSGSNSNVSKGCKNGYSDLINEPACKAAGGKWGQTNKPGQAAAYGCMNPNGGTPDDQNGSNSDKGIAEGVKGNVIGQTSTCGAARTNLIACKGKGEQALGDVLKIIISVLTVIIGIAATGGLAWAAILYAKAEDNASNVSEAKTLIRNIVIGILLYGFMVAIVNWLVPGGLIG
ncbi:MAG: hypothetical protein QG549_772 [Patescibacteria group bacterium]|nr:hypothetical protein [Patescibacteria group bacterium]